MDLLLMCQVIRIYQEYRALIRKMIMMILMKTKRFDRIFTILCLIMCKIINNIIIIRVIIILKLGLLFSFFICEILLLKCINANDFCLSIICIVMEFTYTNKRSASKDPIHSIKRNKLTPTILSKNKKSNDMFRSKVFFSNNKQSIFLHKNGLDSRQL